MNTDVWMVTRSGKLFHPFKPVATEVSLYDIASALSEMPRYNGHGAPGYSVAQHAMLAAGIILRVCEERKIKYDCTPDELVLSALHHDSSEAYLPDAIRPYKHGLSFFLEEPNAAEDGVFGQYYEFKVVEDRILKVIFDKYKLPWPMLPAVKVVDDILLATEMAAFWPKQYAAGLFNFLTEQPIGALAVMADAESSRQAFTDVHLRRREA